MTKLANNERSNEKQLKIQELIDKYYLEDEKTKDESLLISYGFWDGSRKNEKIEIKRSSTILDFLKLVLSKSNEKLTLKKNDDPNSIYAVKENYIFPHDMTFHEIIKIESMEQSCVFNFEKEDDVLVDRGRPIKVVNKSWYEEFKHVFPASRWVVYTSNI